jgi:hypothetical protein
LHIYCTVRISYFKNIKHSGGIGRNVEKVEEVEEVEETTEQRQYYRIPLLGGVRGG